MKTHAKVGLYLALFLFLPAHLSIAQPGSWKPIGPAIGIVSALAINDAGHVFAGTSEGMVYRSTDQGAHWTLVHIVDRNPTDALFITAAGHILAGFSGLGGAYRSTDNGDTWEQTSMNRHSVVAFARSSEGILFAGSDFAGDGVYRSLDDGVTWNGIAFSDTSITALTVDAQDHLLAATPEGVFHSSDSGASWQPTGLQDIRVRVLITGNEGSVFAGTETGVYRTTDDGTTWTPLNQGLTNVNVLALTSNGDGVLFTGTVGGIFRSTNNGASWSGVDAGLTDGRVPSIATGADGLLFAGVGIDAVFRSENNGNSWSKASEGITPSRVRAVLMNTQDYLFAATSLGVYRSPDDGETWERSLSIDSRVFRSFARYANGDIWAGNDYLIVELFNARDYGDIYYSSDNGANWERIARRLDDAVTALGVNSTGRIFAGTPESIYRMNNSGIMNALLRAEVFALAINAFDHVFMATADGVYRTTNDGLDWDLVFSAQNETIAIAIDATGTVFVGVPGEGIYRSKDNGETWTPVNSGLGNTEILALVADMRVIAGTKDGVFYSTDGGDQWRALDEGLAFPHVRALALGNDGSIYAGTQFGGAFRLSENVPSALDPSPDVPARFWLEPNYPNPFRTSTTIAFSLDEPTPVRLNLFNVLGREVKIMIDRTMASGSYRIQLDATSLPSGVYFYRLETPSSSVTRQMYRIK